MKGPASTTQSAMETARNHFLIAGQIGALLLASRSGPRRRQGWAAGLSRWRDAVRVFVTVTDRDGRPVTNLTRDNFEVRTTGKRSRHTQRRRQPAADPPDRHAGRVGQHGSNLSLLRDAATQLFSRLLPDDLARVVGVFGEDVKISPTFTATPTSSWRRCPRGLRRRAHTTLARPGRRARRIRRHRRLAQGDSR